MGESPAETSRDHAPATARLPRIAASSTNRSSSSTTTSNPATPLPSTPLRRYFSRRGSSSLKVIPELPTGHDFVGIYSPWALLWGLLFLTVPLSYVYIALVLLREVCRNYPHLLEYSYVPSMVGSVVSYMQQKSWRIVEYWCWLEAAFYIVVKLKIYWLQRKDPLEASLSAAPLLELDERHVLWRRMMDSEVDDPVGFLTGWFFDCPIEKITKYDVRDFTAWSMFEGRHQEHLTNDELRQLEDFVEEAEYRISLQLYGESLDDDGDENVIEGDDRSVDHREGEEKDHSSSRNLLAANEDGEQDFEHTLRSPTSNQTRAKPLGRKNRTVSPRRHRPKASTTPAWKEQLPKPKQMFHFAEESQQQEVSFFVNLYESYRAHYESMRNGDFRPVQELLRDKLVDFHPIQDLRNLFNETAQQLSHAEETAMATATQMYEQLVPTGSQMDKHLTAMSQATYAQLSEAWNSVKNMKERLETARFLSQQRARIRQQLKGYRVTLNRMREMSGAIPSAQMAAMMRRITECNVALESLESRAQAAFVKATGFARKNLPTFVTQVRDEPRHYAMYSSDPLLGIATYPLGFHLLVLGGTEIPLRILMKRRGFERRSIGPVSYYFHPGRHALERYGGSSDDYDSFDRATDSGTDDSDIEMKTPIIFVHGIGIGLIVYIPLIDKLLETGRPILLPEIPYVSGFRPWLSPLAVLSPGSVVSTMTAMLASHGFIRGSWVGHSYGTSWLSYMAKFATHAVASLLFLDPICFSLHAPHLTKQFVYSKPDPGTISYIVRTDIIVNWTIQRSFPWAWIILFLEQIGDVPCGIFLSDRDALVPVDKVETYLKKRNVPIQDFEGVDPQHFNQPLHCTVFRGDGHGDWTERPSATVSTIATAVEALSCQAELRTELFDEE